MKKVLSWILLLTLVLGLFAGCRNTQNDVTTEPQGTISEGDIDGINAAMDYLKAIYKNTEEAQKTAVDYTRYGVVRIAGVPYEVVWSVDVSEEFVEIIVNDDGTVTIHIVKAGEEDTPYTLTATITDAVGNSVSHSWNMVIPAAVDQVSIVKEAYALKSGESMDHEVTLTGKIISIDTAYDPDYKNITCTIEIEGAEDMPIKCYRLKGEGAEELCVGDTITVTGTIKNYNGTVEFDSGCVLVAVVPGDRIKAPEDMKEIVDQAYKLGANKSLPYEATLTGKITMVKQAYDAAYGNITVEMVVEGRENYPILCYRLKGSGVESIGVNDIITVTGYIINYVGENGKSTIEYTNGCKLVSWIDKPGPVVPSDPKEIVDQAYALGANKSLPYEATLTGRITKVTRAYDPAYGNVSVQIVIAGREDKPIVCYNMTGNGIANIDIGDTITVKGYIENYVGDKGYSTIEYNRPVLLSYTKNPNKAPSDPVEIVKAAYALKGGESLPYKAVLTGKVTKIANAYDPSYNNITVIIEVPGAEDMPIKCFRMKGTDISKIAVGDTITVSGYIINYQHESGDTEVEYEAGCMMTNRVSGGGVTPTTPTVPNGEYVKNPEAGVAYKLGIYNGKGIYLFTGKTDNASYRLATTQDSSKAIDVYVEQVSGGYHLYFMDGTTKTYIRTYERTSKNDNGEDVKSGSLELVTSAPAEVYTYNSVLNTFVVYVGENFYYLGTYGTYTNISGQKSYYVTGENAGNVDVSQFPARLYPADIETEEPTTTEPTTTTPTAPSVPSDEYVVVTDIAPETAYKLGVNIGTKTLYFDGKTKDGQSWYLTTTENVNEAVDVKLESADGGYLLYFMDGETKTYLHVYQYTNDKGNLSGTLELTTTKPTDVYTLNEVYNTLVYVASETNSYYVGTYTNKNGITYETLSASSLSYMNATNVDVTQFPARLYTQSVEPDPEPTTTEPTTTAPTAPSVPSDEYVVVTDIAPETAYKLGVNIGTKTLYFDGTNYNGKAYKLNVTEDATKAVDVKLESADGGYLLYFMDGDTKTYIHAFEYQSATSSYPSGTLELTTTKPTDVYTLNEAVNTLVTAIGDNSYFLGTYYNSKYSNTEECISGSSTYYITGDNAGNVDVTQFPARLYAQSAGSTEPPATSAPDRPVASGFVKVTEEQTDYSGTYLFVCEDLNQAMDSALSTLSDNAANGKAITIANGAIEASDAMKAIAVIIEKVEGGYLLRTVDGRYLSRSSNFTGIEITEDKASAGIVSIAWENGNVKITGEGGAVFCVDNYKNKNRFVFLATKYLNDSYPVYLYKLTETEEPEPDDGTVSIATALAGENGETFKVKGVVTLVDGQNIYVQDNTGAICLRMTSAPTDISLGNTIIGTGSKSVYNGLTQLGSATYEKSEGMTLQPKETTIGALTTADICAYVKLTGLTVTEVYDNNGAYSAPNITVQDNDGNSIQLYKAVVDKVDGAWNVKVGDVINVYAAVGYFNKYQLRNTIAAEIGVVTSGSTEPPTSTTTAPTTPVDPATGVKYTFANYTAGTQFAKGEEHKLDETVTVISNGAHFTSQLRIYSLTDKNVENCHAIIQSAKVIKSIDLTAGNKVDILNVYGSVDGETYTLIKAVDITATSYKSYTVDMPEGTAYKYLKLEAPNQQIRIQDMTITFAE